MDFDDFKKVYTVHRMDEQEVVAAFDCGDEDLNGFILNEEDADEPTRLLYFDLNDLDED